MKLEDLVQNSAGWLDSTGERSGVVVSSRARLARNLRSSPFVHRSSETEQAKVVELVLAAHKGSARLRRTAFFLTNGLPDTDRQVLVERHLISPALAQRKGQGGVLVSRDETLSVMINEEDHLRLQAILSGFNPEGAWRLCDTLDDELSEALEYAFSDKWGYLTACPTNTGTGLRVSVLIHLPALVLTQDMDRVIRGVTQMDFAVRGLYGEGTDVVGNLFQISNQVTMGRSEEEIVSDLENVVRKIMTYEKDAQETLVKDAKSQIEDKIWRAYGILKHARVLSTQEFMSLSSAIRLGCNLGVIGRPDIRMLNELMIVTQPSHLQRLLGKRLDPSERDVLRARLVRERLGAEDSH